MPRPRFARLAPDTQRRILETAAAEFAEHGFRHASLNHIISALQLSKGVFYYYFDSKADLFTAVIDLVWDLVFPSRSFDVASLDAETYWPRIETLLRENHALLRDHSWLAGMSKLLYDPPRGAGIDSKIDEKLSVAHAWLEALIRRGQDVGTVRRDVPTEMLLAVLTAADQAGDRWLFGHWDELTPVERERLTLRIFALWRRIAEPAPAAGRENGS